MTTGWTRHTGKAVVLDRESIDTDQLIPARFMSTPRSKGYGDFLLHDLRFGADGEANPTDPLNRHSDATVIVTRRNFGSGSSREAAVYALMDFGIKAILAPSFGDIFASNAVNNGLLPAKLEDEAINILISAMTIQAENLVVDLEQKEIGLADRTFAFDIDDIWREKLLNGWDDIDLTLSHQPAIAAYREDIKANQTWRFPADAG